jgi:hypothetical protein
VSTLRSKGNDPPPKTRWTAAISHGERRDAHLKCDAGETAKNFIHLGYLFATVSGSPITSITKWGLGQHGSVRIHWAAFSAIEAGIAGRFSTTRLSAGRITLGGVGGCSASGPEKPV